MKILISFADESFKKEQQYLKQTGLQIGGFDKTVEYSPNDIDEHFKKENEEILKLKRGHGFWIWKPYFILKTLQEMKDGDYLFYCDSACYFVNSIDLLVDTLEYNKLSIMTFESQLNEIQYTKDEAFKIMNADTEQFKYSPQIVGSFILLKKNTESLRIVEEYLAFSSEIKLISDDLDKQRQHQYFIDHRHDQSIWSLLIKKKGLLTFKDPSQYGNMVFEYLKHPYNNAGISHLTIRKYKTNYPTILIQYRKERLYLFKKRILFELKLNMKLKLYKLLFNYMFLIIYEKDTSNP